jgi:hypothetical protein
MMVLFVCLCVLDVFILSGWIIDMIDGADGFIAGLFLMLICSFLTFGVGFTMDRSYDIKKIETKRCDFEISQYDVRLFVDGEEKMTYDNYKVVEKIKQSEIDSIEIPVYEINTYGLFGCNATYYTMDSTDDRIIDLKKR